MAVEATPVQGGLGDGPVRRGFGQEMEALRQGRPVRGNVGVRDCPAIRMDLLADVAVHVVAVLDERDPPGVGGEANGNIRDSRATSPRYIPQVDGVSQYPVEGGSRQKAPLRPGCAITQSVVTSTMRGSEMPRRREEGHRT